MEPRLNMSTSPFPGMRVKKVCYIWCDFNGLSLSSVIELFTYSCYTVNWHASFSCAIFNNWRIQNRKVMWAWPYGGSLSSTGYNILFTIFTFNICAKREVFCFNLSVKKIGMQPIFHKYGWLVVIHGYKQRQSLIHYIRYHFLLAFTQI